MIDPKSEPPTPAPANSPPVGSDLQQQPLFTPIPQYSEKKWGRRAGLIVLCLVGVTWGLGWLEPLIDAVSPVLCPVTGTVRYNGKPLTGGFVRTICERGGMMGALGPISADGTFELNTNGTPGAYSGRHRVLVFLMDGGFPPKSLLPEKYLDPQTSPLSIRISRSRPNKVQLEMDDAKTP